MSGNLPGPSMAWDDAIVPSIVCLSLAPIVVAIRFWARIRIYHNVGWDDWTILISLIMGVIITVLMLAACSYGFGQHIANLTPYNRSRTLELFYFAQVLYKANTNITKCSILILYLRIFTLPRFRQLCWILLGVVVTYTAAAVLVAIFQCTPIDRAWDKSIPGTCVNNTTNWFANAGFSIATDVIILVMPMPVIYSLKLRLNQKVALMFVFALGSFVTVTSIVRMQSLDFSSSSPDNTYNIELTLWTIYEIFLGIICASLPACRAPLALLFPNIFTSSTGTSPQNPSYPLSGSTLSKKSKLSSSASRFSTNLSRDAWTRGRPGEEHRVSVRADGGGGDGGFGGDERDNNSSEHILREPDAAYHRPEDGIQLTTQYSVKFEKLETLEGDEMV